MHNMWFSFYFSFYKKHYNYQGVWYGIGVWWRFPWEKLNEGDYYPHGFELMTDFIPYWRIVNGW